MKFRVTTSEVIGKIFEVEAEDEKKVRALDSFMYKELISVKTISREITDVEKIE